MSNAFARSKNTYQHVGGHDEGPQCPVQGVSAAWWLSLLVEHQIGLGQGPAAHEHKAYQRIIARIVSIHRTTRR